MSRLVLAWLCVCAVAAVAAVSSAKSHRQRSSDGWFPVLNDGLRSSRVQKIIASMLDAHHEPSKPRHPPLSLQDKIQAIDDFVTALNKCFQLPGLAVSLVQNNQTVFAKGYGFADADGKQPVDEFTLFGIGSVSKAFTATLFAKRVDAGTANWDSLVTQYLPYFALNNPSAKDVTPRDLACHRTGVPRNDLAWISGPNMTRQQHVAALSYLPSNLPFRYKWQYNNFMWVAMGAIVESLSNGTQWEDVVAKEIFEPVGMTNSTAWTDDALASSNYAVPHGWLNNTNVPLDMKLTRPIQEVGPAGAISSSANDMAQWMLFHLNQGAVNGHQLVSSAALLETYTAEMNQRSVNQYLPVWSGFEIAIDGYAKGWATGTYRGYKLYTHDGATLGHHSNIWLFPGAQLGYFVSSNTVSHYADLVEAFVLFYAVDTLLGLTPWITVQMACAQAPPTHNYEHPEREETKTADWTLKSTTLPNYNYSGTYQNPAYGHIYIQQNGDSLLARINLMDGPLTPLDTSGLIFKFVLGADWQPLLPGLWSRFNFQLNSISSIVSLTAGMDVDESVYTFTKLT